MVSLAFAGEVDELVELEVQVAEVGSDDVPVRLLALQVQLDQIDQAPAAGWRSARAMPEIPVVLLLCDVLW